MRAFLSHSSKDKGFVESVASQLRPGTYHLDSETFDSGVLNFQAIISALKTSDIFCLFLSEESLSSSYVSFEILFGTEFFAAGIIKRVLVICIDETSFNLCPKNLKSFSFVRKAPGIESTGRLIQGQLVSSAKTQETNSHPFFGREDELIELEKQVNDHSRPLTKAIFVSGNFGAGRRTFARKFFSAQYPDVSSIFPIVEIDSYSGSDELYRKFLAALHPTYTLKELSVRITGFNIANKQEKKRLSSELINSLLVSKEALIIMDRGGVINNDGSLTEEMNDIIDGLQARPHPPAIIIAGRMTPMPLRRSEKDVSYVPLRSLSRYNSKRILQKILRDRSLTASNEQMENLIDLSDGHPFNMYQMVDVIKEKTLSVFLADTAGFREWKHKNSSEYLRGLSLNATHIRVISVLRLVPELDFDAIVGASELDTVKVSEAISDLCDMHLVEFDDDRFKIALAVRVAVERDERLKSRKADIKALKFISESLTIRLEEGSAPLALVNTAVIASLNAGVVPVVFSAFLLPSHYVWLAHRFYDQKNWTESLRLSKRAIVSPDRLSLNGLIGACRFLCLSATRLSKDADFDLGLRTLRIRESDLWAKSNIEYLQGFNFRMKGDQPRAEDLFRKAYKIAPGNLSAGREIAAICLARGDLITAERFAREVYSHAKDNEYFVDILISVIVRRHGRSADYAGELEMLFDTLKTVGEGEGKSFFSTRRAEFEHLYGNNRQAILLIEQAIIQTPHIFEPRRLAFDIFIKDGNRAKAHTHLQEMEKIVGSNSPQEGRTNQRELIECQASYLVEMGQFQAAKNLYEDRRFTKKERADAVKSIEVAQSYKRKD